MTSRCAPSCSKRLSAKVGLHTDMSVRSSAAARKVAVAKSESSDEAVSVTQAGTGEVMRVKARLAGESSARSSLTLALVDARRLVGTHDSDQ